MTVQRAAVIVTWLAAACSASAPAPATPTAVADRRVEVVGVAQNAKAGAVLQTADRGVVYVTGREAWPDALVGRRLRAAGTLRVVRHEDPCPPPHVDCAAGMAGDQQLLDDAVVTDEAGNPVR